MQQSCNAGPCAAKPNSSLDLFRVCFAAEVRDNKIHEKFMFHWKLVLLLQIQLSVVLQQFRQISVAEVASAARWHDPWCK